MFRTIGLCLFSGVWGLLLFCQCAEVLAFLVNQNPLLLFGVPTLWFFSLSYLELRSPSQKFGVTGVLLIILVSGLRIGIYQRAIIRPLTNQRILITGASSGIGKELAEACLALEAEVIMTCRSASRCLEAYQDILSRHPTRASALSWIGDLDLASLEAIELFVQGLAPRGIGQVDVLVNNAGLAGQPPRLANGIEPLIATMYLGHHYLTSQLRPFLSASKNPRVITISSIMGSACGLSEHIFRMSKYCFDRHQFFDPNLQVAEISIFQETLPEFEYMRAKLAQTLHAYELSRQYSEIASLSIELGWVRSNIQPWMKYLPFWALPSTAHGIRPILHAISVENPLEFSGMQLSPLLAFSYPLEFSQGFWNADDQWTLSKVSERLWRATREVLFRFEEDSFIRQHKRAVEDWQRQNHTPQ